MRVDLKARPHKVSTWAVTVTDRIYDVVFLRDSCSVNRCKTRSKATYCGNLTFYVSVVISQSLLTFQGYVLREPDRFYVAVVISQSLLTFQGYVLREPDRFYVAVVISQSLLAFQGYVLREPDGFYVSVVISQSLLACYIQSVVGWLARHADAFWGSQFLSLPQYCRISSTHDSIRHG